MDSSNLSIHSFVKVAPADPILNPHEHSCIANVNRPTQTAVFTWMAQIIHINHSYHLVQGLSFLPIYIED